jgi:hypothetical protein
MTSDQATSGARQLAGGGTARAIAWGTAAAVLLYFVSGIPSFLMSYADTGGGGASREGATLGSAIVLFARAGLAAALGGYVAAGRALSWTSASIGVGVILGLFALLAAPAPALVATLISPVAAPAGAWLRARRAA